ncbi:MAG TPA: SpoIIE family protein phosphatase [Solirubrobacteraceae bacterium]|nr:SpoIIE family protein phosphatase [Solirubrobacteraceae bacterium]
MRPESAEAILEIARSAFVTLDADGRVLYWNRRATELFGYSREDVLGVDLAELIVPERYREDHRAGLRRARSATGGDSPRLTVEALRHDGSELPVEVSMTVVRDGDEGGRVLFHAWIDDVSERTQLLRELEAQLRGREPGFGEILDALAEAVTIRDPHHHILYANRAACESMGFASLEDMQRRPPQSIFADYIVQSEHGEDLTMDAIPSVRLLAGEPAEPLVIRTINRSTGELRWQLLKAAPLHGEDGRPVAAVTIIEDITRERIAELHDRFLARASDTLMSSLDYEETLRNVAWLAVPEVADWCAVELVDERGARQRVAVAHRDPAKLDLAERLRAFEPEKLDPNRGVGRILRTGASELYQDIPDEALVAAAVNDEHLSLLRSLGFRSVMLVPLRARGRTFGVMTLVTAESMRRFAEADLEFAEQVASRAAIAVDNAVLATARRHTAETLQRSLLPDVVPKLDGWNVATFYRAAYVVGEIEVGGDFFDFYETDDAWIVLLGDVTGKGVEAAALTSLVRHGARFLSKYERSPSRILVGLNDALSERPGLLLCTAVCVRLDRGQAVIASAGHPTPLIVRDDGRVREIGTPGPILGASTGRVPADRPVPVATDETLLLYTDGVIDTLGEQERFGADRLRRLLAAQAGATPDELLSELEAGLDRFQAGAQADDTAALALRPEPPAGGAQSRAKHLAGASRTLRVS